MQWTGRHGIQIGAGAYSGEVMSYFPGVIDDVAVFEKRMWGGSHVKALFEEWVAAVPGRPAIAHYEFSETMGSEMVHSRAHVRSASLVGGVEAGVPGTSGSAVRLNGEDAYLRVAAAHINTHRSYTVSVWAKVDPGNHSEEKVVVAQQGIERPGFTLYYSGASKRWVFGTYESDRADASLVWVGQEPGAAIQGEWTPLVGVHDVVANTLSLYVNGKLVNSIPWDKSVSYVECGSLSGHGE
ncbi:hypothetical protein FNQ90_01605 [Streptomyces alkaliphilus]|uniref:LamG domain-containing protein n=2 Tax=Streptomyces alkaliphilus TaxID=1472722 RepID=A0A7W3XZY4_9ACTN|nr:hypothetical protein [Streptomyces alkaliphilus]